MQTDQELQPILSAILIELRRQRVPDDLWTADDIASYCKKSKSTVQQRLLTKAGFPRPVALPTTDRNGAKLWYADEVRSWVKSHRVTS